MQLRLSLCLSSSQPWTGSCFAFGATDGFFQNVSFTSIWNGTDNAAAFLARPLNLQGIRWSYGLCPADFDPVPGGGILSQWNCVTYGNLTATVCDSVDCGPCTPATLDRDVDLTTPIFEGYSASCAASMPSGTIDGSYQPWQGVPLQIFIT